MQNDDGINKLIYKLHGFTQEEIDIIEKIYEK